MKKTLYIMKLRLLALLIFGSFVFTSCNKKQCPAYGQVENTTEVEIVPV
ncbi:MAG: hypothetical protein ACI9IP_002636 [Arcticibacterium sp.]|jgi:hypothetical protein